MSALRIILVRHGETEWNRLHLCQGFSDLELNDMGRRQAECIGLALKEKHVKAVYASPLCRALQTAEAIARHHQVTVQTRDGLKELNHGDFEGLRAPELAERYPDFIAEWRIHPERLKLPNGETIQEVQARAWAAMEGILAAHRDGVLVVVGHSFTNVTILAKLLGYELSEFRRLRQDAASISTIDLDGNGARVVSLNDTSHLIGCHSPPPAGLTSDGQATAVTFEGLESAHPHHAKDH